MSNANKKYKNINTIIKHYEKTKQNYTSYEVPQD